MYSSQGNVAYQFLFEVANFPFPTQPEKNSLEEAEKRLIRLGALRVTVKNNVVSF